jgi:glycosyltransferase involved in cell wall biosynthesis
MHIFLNALGASTASGLTYLRNVLPHLAASQDIRTTVAMTAPAQAEFRGVNGISFANLPHLNGAVTRFWFEQRRLPSLLRELHVDVLISAGNFAVRNSPVPQILLSGNSLYTSGDFYRDLFARREYGLWLDTKVKAGIARKSVKWADRTVAPTQAFADELQRWTGKAATAIHHGFDHSVFFEDQTPLSQAIQSRLDSAEDCTKLLYVSHYNYFRNFETLFRALPLMRETPGGEKVRLFVTCKLRAGENPGAYKTNSAWSLVKQLGIENEIVQLGAVPYHQLHHLYRSCDVYVTPSYAETFAHPLVEAMACGLPIVASDLPVHREVCGGAALYFDVSRPDLLARSVSRVARAKELRLRLKLHGLRRALDFSWASHVGSLLEIAKRLTRGQVCSKEADPSMKTADFRAAG